MPNVLNLLFIIVQFLIAASSYATNVVDEKKFDKPGQYEYEAPAGITKLKVKVVGAGGGGGISVYGCSYLATGGGGGAMIEAEVTIQPGQKIPIVVGKGGAKAPGKNGSSAWNCWGNSSKAGGSSSFGDYVVAGGGGASRHWHYAGLDGQGRNRCAQGGKFSTSGEVKIISSQNGGNSCSSCSVSSKCSVCGGKGGDGTSGSCDTSSPSLAAGGWGSGQCTNGTGSRLPEGKASNGGNGYVSVKPSCDPNATVKETNCASGIFHPKTLRCIHEEVVEHKNGYVFTERGLCVPSFNNAQGKCIIYPRWSGCAAIIPVDIIGLPENDIITTDVSKVCKQQVGEFLQSCKEYGQCYNDSITTTLKIIEDKKRSEEFADNDFFNKINDGLAAAKTCQDNYLKLVGGDSVFNSVAEQEKQDANDATGGAKSPSDDANNFNSPGGKASSGFVKSGGVNVLSPSSGSANSTDKSGNSGFIKNTANQPSEDGVLKWARSGSGMKNNSASGKGANYNYGRSKSTGSNGASSFTFSNKAKAPASTQGKEKVFNKEKQNSKYSGYRSIFEMVTNQYKSRHEEMRSIDSYLRKL